MADQRYQVGMDAQPPKAEPDGVEDQRRALRELFFDEAEELVEELELVCSNFEAARRATHTLKANAAMMGFHGLASLVHQAESELAACCSADRWRAHARAIAGELRRCRCEPASGEVAATPVPALTRSRPKPLAPTAPAGAESADWVRVVLTPDCPMPAARATLLLSRVGQMADPVIVVPAPETWTQPEFDRELTFWVPAAASTRVARALESEPEVTEVTTATVRTPGWLSSNLLIAQLRDLVSQLETQTGKRLSFVAPEEPPDLPRAVFVALRDALVHLVRNAADHGIEQPDERAALGKPSCGEIRFDLWTDGEFRCASLSDDGRGLDREALQRRAADLGVVSGQDEIAFLDGLSTRDDVTELSGRGVGLAAVKSRIESLGGDAAIASEAGSGTTVTLRVPWSKVRRAA